MHLCWAESIESTMAFPKQRGVPDSLNLRGSEGSLQEVCLWLFCLSNTVVSSGTNSLTDQYYV